MKRVTCDPAVLGGKPTLEGTRISVEQILGLLAKGMTGEAIVEAFPILQVDDVSTALRYARAALRNDVVPDVE